MIQERQFMRYTRFGQTDLEVSTMCFGTWQGGGDWGSIEETAGALQELVDEGKIRYIGVSKFDTEQMSEFEQHRKIASLPTTSSDVISRKTYSLTARSTA